MTRATVCLTVDFDAVSPWLHVDGGDRDSPTNRSRGVFGAEVGAPRLLDLFDRHDLPTTWFVPGHTAESFPDVCERVHAAGHPIEHHGWSHRPPGSYADRERERADLLRGIEAIEALTGRRPEGYRSPSWDLSEHTLDLLLELDFEWDSSGMAREFEPYHLRRDAVREDGTYAVGEETDLVTLPVSWHRDDYPPLAFSPGRAAADEAATFEQWRRQFDWMYDTVDGGVYVLTMHPQVMGQSSRVARLEAFVEHVAGKPGVEFATCGAVAADARA
jgi:peptidoglycan/xylan/chitin deacetylase (PgdA/CDA1 family)